MSSTNVPAEKDYDPVKNPRPEDLNAYGVGQALVWFFLLLAIGLALYFGISWML